MKISTAVGAFVLASLAAAVAKVAVLVVGLSALLGWLPAPVWDFLVTFPIGDAVALFAFIGTLGVIYR